MLEFLSRLKVEYASAAELLVAAGQRYVRPMLGTISFRLAIVAIFCLFTGIMFIHAGWTGWRAYEAMKTRGVETVAQITGVTVQEGKNGKKSYLVALSWSDRSGRPRSSRPRHVSEAFWLSVAPNGNLAIRQTHIRYLEDQPDVLPLVIADRGEHEYQLSVATFGGPIAVLIGAFLGWLAWRRARPAAMRV